MRNPDHGGDSAALVIEKSAPRVVFAQLVARALGASQMQPSAMAIAYLVEMLSDRVRETPHAGEDQADTEDGTLRRLDAPRQRCRHVGHPEEAPEPLRIGTRWNPGGAVQAHLGGLELSRSFCCYCSTKPTVHGFWGRDAIGG